MPLISVCLTTYNGERFLAQQMQSVLDQTERDLEVVVGDDGSTDNTLAILEGFAERDSRVRILPAGPRLGMQKNYERVIAASSGRYIAPCDQDDVWLPEKLEALLALLRERDVPMAYCDSALIDEEGRSLNKTMLTSRYTIEGRDPFMFAFHNSVSGHAMIFDRALLSHALPFPEEPFYDWWIAAIAAATGGIAVLRSALVLYRQHGYSVTFALKRDAPTTGVERFFETCLADTKRLAAFGNLPGDAGRAYGQLAELWPRRTREYLLPKLSLLLLRHPGVFAPRETSFLRTRWRCVKRGIGLPLQHPVEAREFNRNRDDG